MTHIAYSFVSPAAAFLSTLMLAGPLQANPDVLVAQTSSSQAPASTKQASDRDTSAKPATDNPVEARIKELHAELKITTAQESLWSDVTQVMRDNEKVMESLHKTRSERAKTMTAVEDVKSYAEIAGAHADGLERFVPVFEALYNSMSDEQKKHADAIFSTRDSMIKRTTKAKRK